ncbi:MAG TPA: 4-alpha-glucanotransferase [Vicinamibacterales bacterium]|nr:4-alpha-glucanotransferase [Vicinamibacterales bacterium]
MSTPERKAGLLVPLSSMPSTSSWGIGEIGDLPVMARWLDQAGFRVLQLLPINEMAQGQTSPYSAISGMAIDPIYLSPRDVRDFTAPGGESRLDLADQVAVRSARNAARVDFANVRRVKEQALRQAFSYFWDVDWIRGTARAGSFAAFCAWEEWWLADYALYRALRDREGGRSWTEWEPPLRDRDPRALERAREELSNEILFHQYLQWLADEQWQDARERMRPVEVFGDFPFMVSKDSADVWAHQHLFRFDATVGVPPDAFSETGQDWGLPVYRWDVMGREDYAWLRQRVRRTARLFDGYRIDHLVGFYRTYSRGAGEREGRFDPVEESDQLALGERLMGIFKSGGARIIAEDLGVVPDFVRASLERMQIPGYRVLRWERRWDEPGQPFKDPAEYPVLSVATTGTHDTETLTTWWRSASVEERRALLALPQFAAFTAGSDAAEMEWTPALHDCVLKALYDSPSELVVLPIQDVFGWEDRINVPGSIADENWTWRLPWPVDALEREPVAQERGRVLRRLAEQSGRHPG